MSYSTLHVHTEASNLRLLDCISKPSQILNKAHDLGLHGVAFTDHESLSSFIKGEQYLEGKREVDEIWNKMKFIRGNEIYLCRNGLNKDNYDRTIDRYYHFILLAKDYKGYLQLCELSRRAWERMFKQYQTRVPTYYNDIIDVIGQEPGHVIGSTACIGSQIGNKLLQVMDNKISLDEAMTFNEAWLNRMTQIIGEENLYIELQPAVSKEQIYVNEHLIELSKITGLPTIITTDAHYINKDDRLIHKAFLKSKNGEREVDEFYEATYLMSEEEIHQRMDKYVGSEIVEKSLRETNNIADRIEDYTLLKPLSIPYLPRPEFDEELDGYSVYQGHYQPVIRAIPWLEKYLESGIDANIQFAFRIINFMMMNEEDGKRLYEYPNKTEQVNTELEIIWNSGVKQNVEWSKYFLQVADYIKIYWTLGDSLTAPSRGSGGASYICYILGITQIDPTREKAPMIFQRFMNPDRASVLDIDTDIQSNRRNQCIKALQKVYGENHVTRVATFKTEKARSAILTAARALDIDVDTARYISSLVQAERGIQYTLDQTYYGDEENGIKPNKQFIQEMEKYPDLWKISRGIEGLISGLGSHAGGVIITEEPITMTCGIMRTSSGDIVTAYDLHEVEAQSLIKIDLLATEGLTKIRTCIDLLCDYGYAKKKPTLRETYEEVVGIYKIDRENPDMWKMVWNNEITSLFQMEQQSGIQGIRLTKPSSLEDLATLNSVIRLMPPDRNAERPLEKFARFKENPQAWEDEMNAAGLNEYQKQLMHSMFDYSNGISAQQEDLYQLMRCEEIVGYSFGQADKLRKAVAKKNPKDYDAFEEQFWKDVKERGSDLNLCRYIWNEMVKPQKGYSFNLAHCLSYSMVALQEMNLAFYYPIIFWNTANLIVDSGAEYKTYLDDLEDITDEDEELEEEEEIKNSTSNYGKIATAIGKMQQKGIFVLPPNINESNITYTINVKKNQITYGLKGIEKVGNKVINEIIAGRPYESVNDFLKRIKVNKTQMVNLIKCGAFDQFGDRVQIMKNYLITVSGGKLKLNLQNLGMLIENDLIPKELYSINISVFKFNKYLRKFKDKTNKVIKLDENALPIYEEHFDMDKTSIDADGNVWLDETYWKNIYDNYMNPLRDFIKKNQQTLLNQLNSKLMEDIYDKYAAGNLAKWSMDSVNFYQGDHELKNVNLKKYNIKNFSELPIDPEVDRSFTAKDGHIINMFKLSRIAGTVIDKDKLKSQITLLTTEGVVTVQAYGVMPQYDKQISEMGADGHKHVIEKSWFSRGNKIIVNGMRRGESTFVAKKYANDPGHHFMLIKEVLPDGNLIIQEERYEVE